MLKISKNTYPIDGIGTHHVGTLCCWVKEANGHLNLMKSDKSGKPLIHEIIKMPGYCYDRNQILGLGKIYARNGNLLSGKKEPELIGVVAKFVKEGWYLELINQIK